MKKVRFKHSFLCVRYTNLLLKIHYFQNNNHKKELSAKILHYKLFSSLYFFFFLFSHKKTKKKMSAPPYQQHDDFYDKPAPPPLPQHIETNRDSTDCYPLNDIPVNSPSPYPVYNQQNNSSSTAVPSPPAHRYSDHSDMKFVDHYDSDDDLEKIIPRERKKRTCMDKLCCGCCTCCPKWARWCSCIFLIIIVILAIIIGVFAALFKVPNVQFTGLKQDPVYAYADNVLSMTFDVGISVDNQNFESITFETIKADVSKIVFKKKIFIY